MRNGFLTAAAILVANAASAWSQETDALPPTLFQVSSESSPDAAEALPAPLTQPAPLAENWAAPPLAGNASYFGSSPYAGSGNRVWVSAGLLVWGLKAGNTPPLVTTDTTGGTGGQIGQPGTATLYGGNQNNVARLGGQFTMGAWLNACQTKGIEGSYFFLNGPSDNFSASSSGAPGSLVLARPFVNAINLQQDREQISVTAFGGISGGSALVSSNSFFQGAQLNGICNLCSSCPTNCCSTGCCQTGCGQTGGYQSGYPSQTGYRMDMLGGFQYLSLNENLVITENLLILPTAPPALDPGSTKMVTDSFGTRNDFYGSQIGVRGEWYRGAWFVNGTGQMALGSTHQEVQISGSTVFTNSGGVAVTQPGGLLALPTNIGTYSRDQFTVVPQIGFNVGRQLTNHVRVYVGYTAIYWSNVVRPGDQIDPVINTTQLPTAAGPGTLVGPARPAFEFRDSDLWAHGLNAGVQFGW